MTMEDTKVDVTPSKRSKKLRSTSEASNDSKSEKDVKIVQNGTASSSEISEVESDKDIPKSPKTKKIVKKAKVEQQKEVKNSIKEENNPDSSPSEEDFLGFDDNAPTSNKKDEQRKNFLSFVEELQSTVDTGVSDTEESGVEDGTDREDKEEEEMTVDTAAASDDTDSDQMEIDSKAGEKVKESDVDIMETESNKSGESKVSKKSENEKTDTADKGNTKIEYCGACSAEVDDAEEGICCDGVCERWFHLRCSGLSQLEYNELSMDENAKWACPKCSGKPTPNLSAESKTPKISVRKDLQDTSTPRLASKRKSIVKEGPSKTPKIDISNPAFLKPFDFGWKRELVYRTTDNTAGKRQGDIYYYTPKGKKLRSLREISEHVVGTELTIDNFTFWKEPIGIDDPEKEIIRDAKIKLSNKDGTASPSLPKKVVTPKVTKAAKTTPKLTATVTPIDSTTGVPITPKASASVTPRVVLKGKTSVAASPKVKIVPTKTATPKVAISKDKKKKSSSDDEMEIGMLPPLWEPTPKSKDKSAGVKRAVEGSEESPVAKRLKSEVPPSPVMNNFMQNVVYMHSALMHAFQYLKVQELLRASRVCHLWHDIAFHKNLWETVRMKNSQVKDWEGFATTLQRAGTKHLDLRKILISGKDDALKAMWTECVQALSKVKTLVKIDFCRCTSSLVEQIAVACPQLENISAVTIKNNEIDFTSIATCKNLTELKIKSQSGIEIKNVEGLGNLNQLRHLSLTTVKNLNVVLEKVGQLTQLESLELGELTNITKETICEALAPLTKLKRLRLEKGQQECPTDAILKTISELPALHQLELINFDIKLGFDDALALCSNIKTLLIIPTYVTQSATTNHLVIEGVGRLSKTLTHFVWGLTLELLRVTDLFIDQWEQTKQVGAKSPPVPPADKSNKKSSGDSIPILKPVKDGKSPKEGVAVTQVDVLQLPKLHKVLTTVLPNTKIIILKVPFSATWRQTIGPNVTQ